MPSLSTKKRFLVLLAIFTIAFLFSAEIAPEYLGGALTKAPGLEDKAESQEVFNETTPKEQPDLPSGRQAKAEGQFDGPATMLALQVSVGDQLDDIAEKLDIISQQISELELQDQNEDRKEEEELEEPKEDQEQEEKDNLKEEATDEQKTVYPIVLIYETKISPIEQRYIKLFNPNDFAVNLTGWYLQRKTETGSSFSSCVSSANFDGKIIFPNSYFVISRGFEQSGIILDNLTLTEKNTLILKNPNGEVSNTAYTAFETVATTGGGGAGGGGGTAEPVYPKILISEVQVLPIEQRFVELYNPNDENVDLTGWYIQRKTTTGADWGSFVSSTNFVGKAISAGGYFVVSRELLNSDILVDIALNDDDSLQLKNPNRGQADEFGWQEAPAESQSLGRKFDEDTQTYLDTDGLSDFEVDAPTPGEKNTAWIEPASDKTAPLVEFSLGAVQNTLNFPVDFLITDPFNIVTPSGLASYVFRWRDNEIDWQEDVPVVVDGAPEIYSGSRDFTGESEKTYLFQLSAIDISGNNSGWLPDIPITTTVSASNQKAIIINEVQVGGQTAKDEFIELYNPNDFDVDLGGFALKKKTASGTESNLVSSGAFNGTIAGLGYFLIVPRANDDGTPNYMESATPDLYYSGKSYSIATSNTVLLYDKNNNLFDKVGWGEAVDCEGACALNPDDSKSISRSGGVDTDDNSADFSIIETPTPGG